LAATTGVTPGCSLGANMAAFTKFDPRNFVRSECDGGRSGSAGVPTLATLAALAGVLPQTQKTRILESITSTNLLPGEKKRGWTPPPAKVAKSAKVGVHPLGATEIVAPGAWYERVAAPTEGEPPFETPCAARRGRVEQRDGLILHFCPACGAWGAYGYEVSIRTGRLGRWYCAVHRPDRTL
jgi:hypothetical protein